ncbi:MAG: hypothetical protein JWO78_642 [Micavibrio sp.]|nr:hypothetical protein [Micavibrio sp.]
MPQYVFKHHDASATRIDMEHTVAAFGNIKVLDYKIASLVVETDEKTADAFAARYKWFVSPVATLDIGQPPAVNYRNMRRLRDLDKD